MDWVTVEEKDANARVLDRGTPPCQYTAIHAPCGQPKQEIFHSRLPSRSRCLVERYPYRPRIKNVSLPSNPRSNVPRLSIGSASHVSLHFCNKLVANQSQRDVG